MKLRGFALAGYIVAFGAISGFPHAERATHKRVDPVERSNALPRSFAAMPSLAAERNTYVYHGGPKSND
jgi:hypothetical protein